MNIKILYSIFLIVSTLFIIGCSAPITLDKNNDIYLKVLTDQTLSRNIQLAATGPYSKDYIEGVIKFPDLQSCLVSDIEFSGIEPLNWQKITNTPQLAICGLWLTQELGNLEKLKLWSDSQGLSANIRERFEGNPNIGTIYIPIVNIEDLRIYPFFSFFKPDSNFVGTFVASTDKEAVIDNFRFEIPTVK